MPPPSARKIFAAFTAPIKMRGFARRDVQRSRA